MVMKQSVIFSIVLLSIVSILASCDFIRDLFPVSKSELTFKATISKDHPNDTILFTGNDIKSINGTTGEIRFVNSSMISKIKSYHWIKCYLGDDSLFTATVTLPVVSALINDLVINLNLNDGNFYFGDGYPDWIDNQGASAIRILNKEKRAPSWIRFIGELKSEGRYIEK